MPQPKDRIYEGETNLNCAQLLEPAVIPEWVTDRYEDPSEVFPSQKRSATGGPASGNELRGPSKLTVFCIYQHLKVKEDTRLFTLADIENAHTEHKDGTENVFNREVYRNIADELVEDGLLVKKNRARMTQYGLPKHKDAAAVFRDPAVDFQVTTKGTYKSNIILTPDIPTFVPDAVFPGYWQEGYLLLKGGVGLSLLFAATPVFGGFTPDPIAIGLLWGLLSVSFAMIAVSFLETVREGYASTKPLKTLSFTSGRGECPVA